MRCTRAYKAKANLAEDEEGRKEAVYKGLYRDHTDAGFVTHC